MDTTHAHAVYGQIKKQEVERLAWLGAQVPDGGLIVEIGAFRGKSAASMLAGAAPSVRLVSIDPWLSYPNKTDQGYETIETVQAYQAAIAPYGKGRITQIIGWPLEVVRFWGAEIDLLFVDCVKDYERLAPIWRAWLPFCVDRIASHDYDPNPKSAQHYPGVVKTLEECCFPITTEHHHVDYTWDGRVTR